MSVGGWLVVVLLFAGCVARERRPNTEALLASARSHLTLGDYRHAQVDAQSCVEADNASADCWKVLSIALAKTEDASAANRAREAYTRYLELMPDVTDAGPTSIPAADWPLPQR